MVCTCVLGLMLQSDIVAMWQPKTASPCSPSAKSNLRGSKITDSRRSEYPASLQGYEYFARLDPIVSDNLAYGTKGLQFQSYKNAKKRVISCRCQEIYISLPHITIKPHAYDARKYTETPFFLPHHRRWVGRRNLYWILILKQIVIWKNNYSYSLWFCYHW